MPADRTIPSPIACTTISREIGAQIAARSSSLHPCAFQACSSSTYPSCPPGRHHHAAAAYDQPNTAAGSIDPAERASTYLEQHPSLTSNRDGSVDADRRAQPTPRAAMQPADSQMCGKSASHKAIVAEFFRLPNRDAKVRVSVDSGSDSGSDGLCRTMSGGSSMSKLFGALRIAAVALAVLTLASAPAHAAYTTFVCTVSGVQLVVGPSGAERVAVNCTASTGGGISWFAYRYSNNPDLAKMLLSVFTSARVSGRPVVVAFESTDTSGNAWGCQSNDCRIILQAVLR
jgi:hypothetical protein